MYKKLFILLFIIICYGCSKKQQDQTKCGPKICTAVFASVGVQFVDKNDNSLNVKNFQALNLRTGLFIKAQGVINPGFLPGYYTIASDGNIKELSAEGDSIRVSGTDSLTAQTKTTIFKIAGGECACYISKISGPEKIAFD